LSKRESLRLFLDSNVLTGGFLAAWGLDKAILSMCAARICRLVLAEAVRDEVEDNLLSRLSAAHVEEAGRMLNDYARLMALMKPEVIPYPSESAVTAARSLIRHAADVPVLLSAIVSRPDWLLTHNTKHFTPAVARRAGLRIATPAEFFREISRSLRALP
jgi:predicted nucleic acid-binding protein